MLSKRNTCRDEARQHSSPDRGSVTSWRCDKHSRFPWCSASFLGRSRVEDSRMACGCGSGMASWSPLSFDGNLRPMGQSYSGFSFLGASRLRSSWNHSDGAGQNSCFKVCGILRGRLGSVLASLLSRPGWHPLGAGPEDPFPWRPVCFVWAPVH